MDFPLFVVASTISTYWATVALLVVYRRLRHGHSAGVLPRQRYERRLWRLIAPVVLAWVTLPWLGLASDVPGLALPAWASWVFPVRAAAAAVAVACYLLSLASWLKLGRNWTMAVVPNQQSQLVTAGVYRWVRHPIYALSILLMAMTAVALPSVPMALVAALHVHVMRRKACHEEGHLLQRFGPQYARYCEEVGRFWPKVPPPTRRAG